MAKRFHLRGPGAHGSRRGRSGLAQMPGLGFQVDRISWWLPKTTKCEEPGVLCTSRILIDSELSRLEMPSYGRKPLAHWYQGFLIGLQPTLPSLSSFKFLGKCFSQQTRLINPWGLISEETSPHPEACFPKRPNHESLYPSRSYYKWFPSQGYRPWIPLRSVLCFIHK